MKSDRGQTALVELLAGSMLIMLILVSLLGFWDKSFQARSESYLVDRMNDAAQQAIDRLAETRGNPANWQAKSPKNINEIGLAGIPLVLDSNKLRTFVLASNQTVGDWNYSAIKSLMEIASYDFSFHVYKITSNVLVEDLEYEVDHSFQTGSFYVLTKKRVATLNENPVILEMVFYYPKE